MPLAVITINWNTTQRSVDTLHLIKQWGRTDVLAIIVDNGSESESVFELRDHIGKNSFLVELSQNKGFSGACNEGIRKALELQAKHILLLNTDAILMADDVKKLAQVLAEDPSIAAAGPLIFDAGRNHLLNAGGKNIAWHYHTNSTQTQDPEKVYDVDYVSGTAIMIKSEAFHKSGLFCEAYFFSGEVADWCATVKKCKTTPNRVVIDPQATANHQPEMASSLRSTLYTYYTVRNRYLYIKRQHMFWSPLLIPLWILRHFLHWRTAKKSDSGFEAGMIWRGVRDGLLGRCGRIDRHWEKLCTSQA